MQNITFNRNDRYAFKHKRIARNVLCIVCKSLGLWALGRHRAKRNNYVGSMQQNDFFFFVSIYFLTKNCTCIYSIKITINCI